MKCIADEAGVDEAGCGSLIGPLVAAAVILPDDFDVRGLNDSKKLSKTKREALYERIMSSAHVGVGVVELDEINANRFSWARATVFQRALQELSKRPTSIVVDGPHFFDGFDDIPFQCRAKADAEYASVAAASVVAKCTRDAMIMSLSDAYTVDAERFGWRSNMGYPTRAHLQAIKIHGPTSHHRINFSPCRTL